MNEPRGEEILYWIDAEGDLITSELTFLEARRALIRLCRSGFSEDDADRIEGMLTMLEASWWVVPITSEVLAVASSPFKFEPVRSLDAIHLATALVIQRSRLDSLIFVALDNRVRVNAIAHWFSVAPLPTEEEWQAADGPRT